MVDYADIGKRIRACRLAKGMTQEQLANEVGVVVTHISHIETGNSVPSLKTLIDIINAHKKHVWVRHVVVPGINDTPEDMEALNVFMKKIRFVDKVELLGYHTMAVEKYGKLGITYRLKGVPPMDSAKLMELQKLIHKPAEAVTRMSL